MIRHIVLFKFKTGVSQEEMEAFAQMLSDLKNEVKYVRVLEVSRDIGAKPNSYDLVLNSLFDSMDDVDKYSVHPAHIKALEMVNKLCEPTVKVDYDTNQVEM